MRVFVISGTGWVGSRVVHALCQHGHEVTVLSRRGAATTCNDRVTFIQGDRSRQDSFYDLLKGIDTDAVIDIIPGYYGKENTERIVDAFSGRIRRFLQCGSVGAFTPLEQIPGREEDTRAPLPENGDVFIRKNDSDEVVLQASAHKGFPGTVIRPTCIMGRGKLPIDNLGGRSEAFIRDILEDRPLEIPGDGRNLIQLVHIDDLAEAFALALESEKAIGESYNIASDRAIAVRDYVKTAAALMGHKARLNMLDPEEILMSHREKGDIAEPDFRFFLEHMCFDWSKACVDLGYRPRYSLKTGLKENLEWARAFLNL